MTSEFPTLIIISAKKLLLIISGVPYHNNTNTAARIFAIRAAVSVALLSCSQLSICRPRNPAMVWVRVNSVSPEGASLGFFPMTTQPSTSPWARIGAATETESVSLLVTMGMGAS